MTKSTMIGEKKRENKKEGWVCSCGNICLPNWKYCHACLNEKPNIDIPILILPIDSGCGWNYWNDTGERVYIEIHKQPYKIMDIRKKDIQSKMKVNIDLRKLKGSRPNHTADLLWKLCHMVEKRIRLSQETEGYPPIDPVDVVKMVNQLLKSN